LIATRRSPRTRSGDRLFYQANRIVRAHTPKLNGAGIQERAHAIRQRIHAIVVRRAPQVMVKVTGGGRGMGAIAAHLRYISKGGRLPIEDDRGFEREGKEALRDLVEQWRLGGSRIPETIERREAFNIMLSMQRLNPRKEDLRRWRETFAERLRGWGIEAEAPSQVTRGTRHRNERVWEGKTGLPREARPERAQALPTGIRKQALQAWAEIMRALAASPEEADRKLAQSIGHYVARVPAVQAIVRHHAQQRKLTGMSRSPVMTPSVQRRGPEIER
jgi:hypothetical protein